MPAALTVSVKSKDLQHLYADLKAAGSDLTVELRHGVVSAAAPLVKAVKGAAPSARVASSIKTKVSFSKSKPGVTIIADPKVAPNAAPINNGGKSGEFRHPVFPSSDETRDQWNWATQTAQPFFDGPITSHLGQADKAMTAVLDAMIKKAGFK